MESLIFDNNYTVSLEISSTPALKFHQVAAIEKMLLLEQNTHSVCDRFNKKIEIDSGIIGLPVGAGKTHVVLAHIYNSPVPVTCSYLKCNHHCPNIIIVPHNIFGQWKTCLEEFAPFNSYISIGSIRNIRKIPFFKKKKYCDQYSIEQNSISSSTRVILIKNTMLHWISKDEPMIVERMFLDEPTLCGWYNTTQFKPKFIWTISAMTSSCACYSAEYQCLSKKMQNISRQIHFRKNSICYCMPVVNCAKEMISEIFQIPEPIYHVYNCTRRNDFDTFLTPTAVRMIRIGAYKEACQLLGLTTFTLVTTINNVKLDLENKINACKENKSFDEKKLNSLVMKYNALTERIEQNTCPICLEFAEKSFLSPCCTQIFCISCILQSIQQYPQCPICRNDVLNWQVKTKSLAELVGEVIKKILQNPNAKILLCSPFDSAFESWLKPNIDESPIAWELVNGNSYVIQNKIQRFNKGSVKVLCLNAYYACAGLNLQCATDLVLISDIYNEWTIYQFLGRAQRPGRTSALNIHKISLVR